MDNKMLTANYLHGMIEQANSAFSNLYRDNDNLDFVHAYVHLDFYAPAHTIYEVGQQAGIVHRGHVERTGSFNGNDSYLTIPVTVNAKLFEIFCNNVSTIAGIRGMEMHEDSTNAEIRQYDRHCEIAYSQYNV